MTIEIKLSGLQRFQEPQSMICGDSIITCGILGLRVAVEGVLFNRLSYPERRSFN
jgi:hypothetical protein